MQLVAAEDDFSSRKGCGWESEKGLESTGAVPKQ